MALLEEFPFESGFRLIDGDLLNKVAAEPAYSVDSTVTAVGTTGPTAYNIRATATIITGGGGTTGVRLPTPQVGRILFIWNFTASSKRVYPHGTETINGAATADIPFSQGMMLICTGANSWAATEATTDASGAVILEAADADTPTGVGQPVQITSGDGGATSGNAGSITIAGGRALGDPGDGGAITITGGDAKAGGSGTGGGVSVTAGAPASALILSTKTTFAQFPTKGSGSITLSTGQSKDAASGTIFVSTGDTTGTGNSGPLLLSTGNAGGAGDSGDLSITAGNAAAGKGGNIGITAGTGTPAGKVTIGPVLTVGGATANTFTVTPGATGSDPVVVASGTPGIQFNSRTGFNSTVPIAKPTITGSRAGNAAVASLLTALALYGLVTDSTSA
jgi:hypothetical protein